MTRVCSQTIDWICYADDLVLAFNDPSNLWKALELLSTMFERYKLKLNISKAKTMILNHQYLQKDYPKTIASLNEIPVENVETFKYLGCQIKFNEQGTGDTKIQLRINASEAKF